jgi:hypothetical protein
MNNFFNHLTTICKHKHYVRQYCWQAGLYKQGILHDLSKFMPIEFIEGVKYYQGNRSPIDACKEKNGYSKAWLHHKGRNPHHYEYWIDNLDNGGQALIMPYKYALELVCDYLGAGRAYMKDNFTYEAEYYWWLQKKTKPLYMHPVIYDFIDRMLYILMVNGNKIDTYILKYLSKDIYNDCLKSFEGGTND